MKVGILQTDTIKKAWAPLFGDYPGMFQNLFQLSPFPVESIIYNVMQGEYPAHLDEVDAYLITGSGTSVYEDLSWIHALSQFVLSLHQARKKLVGICFGHQLIAHILGGETTKSPLGWNVGVQSFSPTQAGLSFSGGWDSFSCIMSHQDQILRPAKDSITLASNDRCEYGMCTIGAHILTLQGHPEFPVAFADKLYRTREHIFGQELYQTAMGSLSRPISYEIMSNWILQFMFPI